MLLNNIFLSSVPLQKNSNMYTKRTRIKIKLNHIRFTRRIRTFFLYICKQYIFMGINIYLTQRFQCRSMRKRRGQKPMQERIGKGMVKKKESKRALFSQSENLQTQSATHIKKRRKRKMTEDHVGAKCNDNSSNNIVQM